MPKDYRVLLKRGRIKYKNETLAHAMQRDPTYCVMFEVTWKDATGIVRNLAPHKEDVNNFLFRDKNIPIEEAWVLYATKYRADLDELFAKRYSVLKQAATTIYGYARDLHNYEAVLRCYCSTETEYCHLALLVDFLVEKFPKAFRKE